MEQALAAVVAMVVMAAVVVLVVLARMIWMMIRMFTQDQKVLSCWFVCLFYFHVICVIFEHVLFSYNF
jgi:hypothetical protein